MPSRFNLDYKKYKIFLKNKIVGENMILLWGWGKSKNAWKKYAPNPTAKTEEEEEINVE